MTIILKNGRHLYFLFFFFMEENGFKSKDHKHENNGTSHTNNSNIEAKKKYKVHLPDGLTKPSILKDIYFSRSENDELVEERITLKNWNPVLLLKDLYKIELKKDEIFNDSDEKIEKFEGWIEKLPINFIKPTKLKKWCKRFITIDEGQLQYYEPGEEILETKYSRMSPNETFLIVGGSIDELGDFQLGLNDNRGRYLVLKCSDEKDYENWRRNIMSHRSYVPPSSAVRPYLDMPCTPDKKVLIVDIGSCSIRAGRLKTDPTLPELFIPCVAACNRDNKKTVYGFDAFKPEVRANSDFVQPIKLSRTVDKYTFDLDVLLPLLDYICDQLKIISAEYWLLLSLPSTSNNQVLEKFIDYVLTKMKMKGINICNESMLCLYAHDSHTGIVLDCGDRIQIAPFTDGYIVEEAIRRLPYGGQAVAQSLNADLTQSENSYRLFTPVEYNIVRYVMERSCYISKNYKEETLKLKNNPDSIKINLNLEKFNVTSGACQTICHDIGRFRAPEGLFNTELWGLDVPSLHKLIKESVSKCPLDIRRRMWQSIFLNGGLTTMPGFVERLQAELCKIVPPSVAVQIHASPNRYHTSYIGACILASLVAFQSAGISQEEWRKNRATSLKKVTKF
ncbi:DgyrCDS9486 [Dimorphilus gyrociliatus]|uniref:DgyrCDS9486 n=1 Tax=Dimorphilus gyrociliatus TaxID=2664684 RepID=A0A7I8VZT8_9ANNE|nr:DgyrCDS9486 [Dimorphilus gyrociliatus]